MTRFVFTSCAALADDGPQEVHATLKATSDFSLEGGLKDPTDLALYHVLLRWERVHNQRFLVLDNGDSFWAGQLGSEFPTQVNGYTLNVRYLGNGRRNPVPFIESINVPHLGDRLFFFEKYFQSREEYGEYIFRQIPLATIYDKWGRTPINDHDLRSHVKTFRTIKKGIDEIALDLYQQDQHKKTRKGQGTTHYRKTEDELGDGKRETTSLKVYLNNLPEGIFTREQEVALATWRTQLEPIIDRAWSRVALGFLLEQPSLLLENAYAATQGQNRTGENYFTPRVLSKEKLDASGVEDNSITDSDGVDPKEYNPKEAHQQRMAQFAAAIEQIYEVRQQAVKHKARRKYVTESSYFNSLEGLISQLEFTPETKGALFKEAMQWYQTKRGHLLDQEKAQISDAINIYHRANGLYEQIVGLFTTYNQRLVVSIAKRYRNRGLDFEDLVGIGTEGTLRAATRFNPALGNKFSTYATWWIRQSITRTLADEGRTIRLPVHIVDTLTKVVKSSAAFYAQHQRRPDDEELAEYMGMALGKIRKFRTLANTPVSLQDHLGEDDDNELGEMVNQDELFLRGVVSNDSNPERLMRRKELAERTYEAIGEVLETRSIDVLCRRFGIGQDNEQTLEEVGEVYSLTRERIRQIEAKALLRLKEKARFEGNLRALRDDHRLPGNDE